jgi:hypothetical protein
MGKIIVSLNVVVELNHLLEDKGMKYRVHLSDACGNQSFSVEPKDNCVCDGQYEEMNSVIIKHFADKNIQIRFLKDKLNFIIEE